jgi:hypothetical protein
MNRLGMVLLFGIAALAVFVTTANQVPGWEFYRAGDLGPTWLHVSIIALTIAAYVAIRRKETGTGTGRTSRQHVPGRRGGLVVVLVLLAVPLAAVGLRAAIGSFQSSLASAGHDAPLSSLGLPVAIGFAGSVAMLVIARILRGGRRALRWLALTACFALSTACGILLSLPADAAVDSAELWSELRRVALLTMVPLIGTAAFTWRIAARPSAAA